MGVLALVYPILKLAIILSEIVHSGIAKQEYLFGETAVITIFITIILLTMLCMLSLIILTDILMIA